MQISRSEQKRRFKEVEKLVAELVQLPGPALKQVESLAEICDQLIETAASKGSVRQRQIKYLTKFVVRLELEPLYDLVGQYRGKKLSEKKQQHRMEFYRDALINEAIAVQEELDEYDETLGEDWESETVAELQGKLPDIDPMTLTRLSALFARTRNTRHSREIFRYLKSVDEMRQRNSQ
jgi:ribosome-associated protein